MGLRALWETWRTPPGRTCWEGGGGVMVRDRGRAGQEGRNHGGCQLQLPTLLTDVDSPSSLVGTESGGFP